MVQNIEKIMDGVTVANGATETATVTIDRADQSVAFYVSGDANGGDVTLAFGVDPDNDVVGSFFTDNAAEEANADLTSGQVFKPDLQPADVIQVSVTNNGASATDITIWAKPYQNR